MRKVAIFVRDLGSNAMANVAVSLARGFNELGVRCDLVIAVASEEDKIKYPDLRIIPLKVKHVKNSLIPLVRYMRKERPEVVFSMPHYINLIAIIAKILSMTKTKVIIGEHNIVSLELFLDDKKLRFLPYFMRLLYPFADGLVAVCGDAIKDLKRINVRLNMPTRVIHNPLEIVKIQKKSGENVGHPWFDKKNIPVIICVARLAEQKNLHVLIKAFSEVLNSVNAKLLIVGEGKLRGRLQTTVDKLGINEHVELIGNKSNPYKFMSRSDLFVLPSAWEGCPLVLIEAMICGIPTIATDGVGDAKIISGYGKYGVVVRAGDYKSLAREIVSLLKDKKLRRFYKKRGFERAKDFDHVKKSREYLDFYLEVCKR